MSNILTLGSQNCIEQGPGARGASSEATFECLPSSSSAPPPSPTLKSSEPPKSHLLPLFLSALLDLLTLTESANTADANGQSLLLPPPPSTCHCLAGGDDKFGEDPNPPSASKANHPDRFMSDDGTQAGSKVRGAGVERSVNAYCACCGLNEEREVEVRDFENESFTTDLRII